MLSQCGIPRKSSKNNTFYACYFIQFPDWRPKMVPLCQEFLSGEKKACGKIKSSEFLEKEKSRMFESSWHSFPITIKFFSSSSI